MLCGILDAFDWDFCQLQLNYYDWILQGARENYNECVKRNIPISVMEPLGGGRLINLPEEAKKLIQNKGLSPASIAIKYVHELPQVFAILSGATEEKQLEENLCAISASTFVDNSLINKIIDIIRDKCAIQCTGCAYCVKECPRNVDIPLCFQKYNDYKLLGIPGQYHSLGDFYFDCVPRINQADNCIKCGKCIKRCPQKIDIPKELERIHLKAEEALLGVSIETLRFLSLNKSIICFGAGQKGLKFTEILTNHGFIVSNYCDNAQKLWGKKLKDITVISPQQLLLNRDNCVVFIASNYYTEIKKQLIKANIEVIN